MAVRSGRFHQAINRVTYQPLTTFTIEPHHTCVIAEHRKDHQTVAALRLRTGRVGFASYLNEINVYLLPGFRHKNIAPFLGYDKRMFHNVDNEFTAADSVIPRKPGKPWFEDYNSDTSFEEAYMIDSAGRRRKKKKRPVEREPEVKILPNGRRQRRRRMIDRPIEYWIVNDFSGCVVLRDYLRENTMKWSDLMRIARGIASALVFMHEYHNCLSENFKLEDAAEAYARGSDYNLRKIDFGTGRGPGGQRCRLLAAPPDTAAIIHRNLTSNNIIIRADFEPMIWNFGMARVIHPMEPLNYIEMIDKPHRKLFETSVYSPPEVLCKNAGHTVSALQASDIYSTSLILWECLTRCKLPSIHGQDDWTNYQRESPLRYTLPFERELGCTDPTYNLLYVNICKRNVRPMLRFCWMLGHKTRRFVKTLMEMWDKDCGCRIQARTLDERLRVLSDRCSQDGVVGNVWRISEPIPIMKYQFDPNELNARPDLNGFRRYGPPKPIFHDHENDSITTGSGSLAEELSEELITIYDYGLKSESDSTSDDESDDEQPFPDYQPPDDPFGPSTSHQQPPPSPPQDERPSRRSLYRRARQADSSPEGRPEKRTRRRLIYSIQPEEEEPKQQPAQPTGAVIASDSDREREDSDEEEAGPDESAGAISFGEFQNISMKDVGGTQSISASSPIKQPVVVKRLPERDPNSSSSRQPLCETPLKFTKKFTRHLHFSRFKNMARSLLA